jgi:DNA-binding CsgD family transcriptional regulator
MRPRDGAALFLFLGGLAAGWWLGRRRPRGRQRRRGLSPRQTQVLRLVASGLTTKQIAARTGTGETTVRTHVRRALETLGAPNRAAAVALLRAREA